MIQRGGNFEQDLPPVPRNTLDMGLQVVQFLSRQPCNNAVPGRRMGILRQTICHH